MMVENITELLAHHGALAFMGAFGIGVLTSAAPCSIVTLPLLVGSALQLENDIDKSKQAAFTIRYSLLFVVGLVLALSILAFLVAKFSYFFSIAPFWAYLLAALVSLLIGLQGIGVLPSINKAPLLNRLVTLKMLGALIIGFVFGIVSTPCASPALIAIISTAEASRYSYAYLLVLVFAIGHASLLLAAGLSLGFAQKISSNRQINFIGTATSKLFSLFLFGMAAYFLYHALKQWI